MQRLSHVLLKNTPPRDPITLPQMPILTFSVKGVLSTSINMYAMEKCSLLPKQFSFSVMWQLKESE